MPCDSTITRTEMKQESRLAAAMRDEGWLDVTETTNMVSGRKDDGQWLSFGRARPIDGFLTTSTNLDAVRAVQRKYSERGVREYAKRAGFAVAGVEGRKITFMKRRG